MSTFDPFSEPCRQQAERENLLIMRALPGVTEQMIQQFYSLYPVSLTTVRIWAEQGSLEIVGDRIVRAFRVLNAADIRALQEALEETPRVWPLDTNCGGCKYFSVNGFISCAVHPKGPEVAPCPDWKAK